MTGRLWYPQLDVHDGVRRFGALLSAFSDPPGIERLCIADFYLANPHLLHLCRMSLDLRRCFRSLKIPRPEKVFLTYPAPPLLFKKMEPIQKEAIRAMTGKELLCIKQLQNGVAELTLIGRSTFESIVRNNLSNDEVSLIYFLTTSFASNGENDPQEIRRCTGLRRLRWV